MGRLLDGHWTCWALRLHHSQDAKREDAVVEDMEVLIRNEDTTEGGIMARCQGRVGWNSAPIASHRLSRNADFQILKPPGKDQRCCQPSWFDRKQQLVGIGNVNSSGANSERIYSKVLFARGQPIRGQPDGPEYLQIKHRLTWPSSLQEAGPSGWSRSFAK